MTKPDYKRIVWLFIAIAGAALMKSATVLATSDHIAPTVGAAACLFVYFIGIMVLAVGLYKLITKETHHDTKTGD
jgi:fatty-acid desaturase